MKINAGAGIRVKRCGDKIQLYSDPIPAGPVITADDEALGTPDDWTTNTEGHGDADPETRDTWERNPGETAEKGLILKIITRTFYSVDDDKNYNFYYKITISTAGKILQVEGEFREVAFETTLHEHEI